MSVLIRGMEMPTSCPECKFFAWKRGVGQHCAVDDRITFHATLDGFDVGYECNGTCPLVEIPPHGKLIEAEPIMKFITDGLNSGEFGYDQIKVLAEIQYAPTIIQAETTLENEIKIIDTKGKPNYDPKHRFVIQTEEGE